MRSIDPVLLSKIKEQNQTIWNNAQPKMEVSVARAKSTVMDSTYWTVETIRQTTGLGDISVAPRRFKAYGRPNRIYEIHVHNGEVKTAIREYPDKLKEGWKHQFSLGLGSSVAVAFNGEWKRYRKLWQLITEEKPWIFWVDNNNVLWSQYWDNETTKYQLDMGVVRVRAIRAWKNVNIADQDQGIVVGYIKNDGTVWYRNYCQQADHSYVWENAKQLTNFVGVAVSVNLFITNDYRMGFIIEDNIGQIHWLITPRNWSGMAIEQHTINARPKATVNLIQVQYHNIYTDEHIAISVSALSNMLFARTDNSIIELNNIPDENDNWGYYIKVILNYPTMEIPTFALVDLTTSANIPISGIGQISSTEYIIEIDSSVLEFGVNDVAGDIQLTVTGFTNEAGYNYDTIIQSFTPINLEPSEIALPEVEVIFNE